MFESAEIKVEGGLWLTVSGMDAGWGQETSIATYIWDTQVVKRLLGLIGRLLDERLRSRC